ncbi:B3 domain-containing protein os03g0120900 [Phtheirospermum japonicum]|uniref:B3 domain-containing protein os03g0120900 n=1 Tax=Phtheirospermum japonicum TaxID=374723 RepID=A0A830B914_9LAMI|nr:B3 domain-containing protein os03g0120900 [Phtheirospermum japonicum]
MPRKPKRHLLFFKALFRDFTRQLKFPLDFARKHILPENAKLKVSSGETWDVEIEKLDGDNIYLNRGWAKFVKDMKLKTFDFLLFRWFTEKSTFQVSCYGKDGCEKEPPGFNYGANGPAKRTRSAKKEASFTDEGKKPDNSNQRFEIVLKDHQRSRVCFPKRFAEAAGLMGKKKVCVDYIPGEQRACVVLDLRPNGTLHLALGWNEFRKSNGLALGEAYLFEFIPSKKVIQVKQKE